MQNVVYQCPKGNIHTAHKKELTERNLRVVNSFRVFRVTGELPVDFDAVMAEDFAILDDIFRSYESEHLSDLTAQKLALQFVSMLQLMGRG